MRHPDRRQAEPFGENVVRQRAADIRQHGRLLVRGLRERRRGPARPRMLRIEARCHHDVVARLRDLHHRKTVPIAQPGDRRWKLLTETRPAPAERGEVYEDEDWNEDEEEEDDYDDNDRDNAGSHLTDEDDEDDEDE